MKKNKKLSDAELLDKLDDISQDFDKETYTLCQDIIERYAAHLGIDAPQNVEDPVSKMTKRQLRIATVYDPTYYGFATNEEIRKAKLLARGHYWDNKEFEEWCSYSPNGKRNNFSYNWFSWGTSIQKKRWKQESDIAAKLWAEGKSKESLAVYDESYEKCHNEGKWVISYKEDK